MNFTDCTDAEVCYESSFAEAGGVSNALRQVRALIGVHELFQMLKAHLSQLAGEKLKHVTEIPLNPS